MKAYLFEAVYFVGGGHLFELVLMMVSVFHIQKEKQNNNWY